MYNENLKLPQAYLKLQKKNTSNVTEDFKKVLAKDGLLPTEKCSKHKDPKKNPITDAMVEDCFAEAIGSYFTYLDYADFESLIGGKTGNDLGDLATELVNVIKKPIGQGGCGGNVDGSNYSCLANLNPNPNKAAVDHLIANAAWARASWNGNLQCAGFARGVSIGVGKDIGPGNAMDYVSSRGNYTWIPFSVTTPMQPGDIPVWSGGGGDQHIAIITTIPPNSTQFFTVAEALGQLKGIVRFFTYSKNNNYIRASGSLRGWLRYGGK